MELIFINRSIRNGWSLFFKSAESDEYKTDNGFILIISKLHTQPKTNYQERRFSGRVGVIKRALKRYP